MILKEFGAGWQKRFESKLQDLITFFPDIHLLSVNRFYGMLRIKFQAPTDQMQYVVDAVTYKIERDSAKVCETCGSPGTRKEEYLSEKLCLCWKCYAIEIDRVMVTQQPTEEEII